MIRGIGDAIAGMYMLWVGAIFAGGVFVGWLLFWALPAAWPAIKQWLHVVTV